MRTTDPDGNSFSLFGRDSDPADEKLKPESTDRKDPAWYDQDSDVVEDYRVNIQAVADLLREGRLRFLFGAGMSCESGLKSGSQLAIDMVKRILGSTELDEAECTRLASMFPFEAIAEAYAESLPDLKRDRRRYMKEVFGDAEPHVGHKALGSLRNYLQSHRLYTTNFDHLLSDGTFGDSAHAITENNEEELSEEASGRVFVVHLHGDFETDEPVISESSYFNIIRRSRLFTEFQRDLTWYNFALVGYSLWDPHIRTIYYGVRSLQKETGNDVRDFVVSPVGSRSEYLLSKRIWKNRNATLIPLPASRFFVLLRDEMRRRESGEVYERVLDKMGNRDAVKAAVEELKKIDGMTDEDAIACLDEVLIGV